jgi:hypothetical protein
MMQGQYPMMQGQPYYPGQPIAQMPVQNAPRPFYGAPPTQQPQTPTIRRTDVVQNEAPATRSVRGVSSTEERGPRVYQPATAPPVAVAIPSPAQLGVAAAPVTPRDPNLDWSRVHQQLKDLGAFGIRLDRLSSGQTRFVCELATTEFGRSQSIEAQADTEAEAVQQVLAKAELWKRTN